jgi:uncharacterized protein (TIGR04255 family)
VVLFKPWALALETTSYKRYSEFAERLDRLLKKTEKLLDSDFFTRVGLRFIDKIPIEDGEVAGWVRQELIAPLSEGVYGQVEKCQQEVRGFTSKARYTFRHGISEPGGPYVLDFDFYDENIEVEATLPLLEQFDREGFRFFSWAIGEKTREKLGKATPLEEI